jgi:uncharacterized protein
MSRSSSRDRTMVSTSGTAEPCIYEGRVFHKRRNGANHSFGYELFFAFVDIDRIESLCRESGVVKYNRLGLVTFDERDHLGDPRKPLRKRLEEDAACHGIELPRGPIFLLTHLRHMGYCFNPASFFYFYDESGRPVTTCIEVRNHFSERGTYWVGRGTPYPFDDQGIARPRKKMHVSPFLPTHGEYAVSTGEPGDCLRIRIDYHPQPGPATLETGVLLKRAPWTPTAIEKAVRRFPKMSIDVAMWIYQEAAALTMKGVRLFWHPEGKLPRVPLP